MRGADAVVDDQAVDLSELGAGQHLHQILRARAGDPAAEPLGGRETDQDQAGGIGAGFHFSIPASDVARRAKVFVAVNRAIGIGGRR